MSAYAKALTSGLAARSEFASMGGSGGYNSMSTLGTPQAPQLPHFLTNNPMPDGKPWGTCNAWNTNYYDYTPNTGVTRYYDWTVSKVPCSPDGVDNTCLLVNNQFPGPTIEANWGDWIEVTVHNDIPDEGTAIHWHGILQKGTPWMDGVPGFGQCPIAPGSTFTYRFQADLYGTSWWHSHYSSQYGSGLVGPMVIYGPHVGPDYDADLGPVMLSDYYHEYYQTVVDELLMPVPKDVIPASDNNLINGKNSFDCSNTTLPCKPNAPLATFNFVSGKTYRIRVINTSGAAVQKFTIDGHNFTVIANDFVPVQPYETDHLTLAVGQRNDILVKATGSPGDAVWMRSYKPPPCWPTKGGDEAKAAIFYQNADKSVPPTSSPGPNAYDQYCGNDPLAQTVPVYSIPTPDATVTEILPLDFRPNATGNLLWYIANRTFEANYNDPILLDVKDGNENFPYIRNVHNYGNDKSLRFVVENPGPQPHPMHMHGHNMFILQEGPCSYAQAGVPDDGAPPINTTGTNVTVKARQASGQPSCWDGSIVRESNPQRRDVHMLLAGQYIVVQWNQDNPGAWPFHCHIAWHLSAGFVWSVVEQPDTVQREMQIPGIMAETCNSWQAWSKNHIVDQIDDGV